MLLTRSHAAAVMCSTLLVRQPLIYHALLLQLRTYKPQDVSNILWALGTLRQPPPDGWLQEMYACTTSNLQQFTSQQLANAAWGLLKLKVLPPQEWVEALAAEHLTRQQAKLGTRRDQATLHNALRTWQMDNALVRIS